MQLFDGEIASAPWEKRFPLSGVPSGEEALVELKCSTFVRTEQVDGLPTPREFGVGLEGIWLEN